VGASKLADTQVLAVKSRFTENTETLRGISVDLA
jgi:hypothetical protein